MPTVTQVAESKSFLALACSTCTNGMVSVYRKHTKIDITKDSHGSDVEKKTEELVYLTKFDALAGQKDLGESLLVLENPDDYITQATIVWSSSNGNIKPLERTY